MAKQSRWSHLSSTFHVELHDYGVVIRYKEHEGKGQLSNSLLHPVHLHMIDAIRSVLGSNQLQLLKIHFIQIVQSV